ncbi:ead/Ea22-like family protein [Citrobacter portucalensis]|uniref:ead/Ea22-like family protein n=1 Tax=Citrobacter portucalensis TaxID=1639133 RepID=UPI002022FDFA|nr:ead/Ea22-like family protein [Citrobacter portucalensis]
MKALNKQALRERYSPQPVPKCHICGAEMTVQRISASRITYGCTGATFDDKGCHYAEGRSIADDHYAQSRVTVVDVSDPDVLEVLDELEKEKGYASVYEAEKWHYHGLAESEGERADRTEKALADAKKCIAELEARKFKVEMPESFYPDGDIDAPLAVDELEVIAAIVEAGGKPVAFCKRCDREIDLTHRPDGSHYCHAPAAGIGVKGD